MQKRDLQSKSMDDVWWNGITEADRSKYIVNNDSHLEAPFDPEFHNLVKSEIARLFDEQVPNAAQSQMAKASHPTKRNSPK